VSENREKLEAPTYLPSKKAVVACQDKLESTKVWIKKGVPVAKTIKIQSDADIDRAFAEFGSPIWVRARTGAGGKGQPTTEKRPLTG
jgi:carbamoyl-phosphate synthase large subunit